jgi:hypothetical protein
MKTERPDERARDLAWAQVDAQRDLQKVRMLLEEALDHIEEAAVLDRDYLNGCVSSALLVAMGKKEAERQIKRGNK